MKEGLLRATNGARSTEPQKLFDDAGPRQALHHPRLGLALGRRGAAREDRRHRCAGRSAGARCRHRRAPADRPRRGGIRREGGSAVPPRWLRLHTRCYELGALSGAAAVLRAGDDRGRRSRRVRRREGRVALHVRRQLDHRQLHAHAVLRQALGAAGRRRRDDRHLRIAQLHLLRRRRRLLPARLRVPASALCKYSSLLASTSRLNPKLLHRTLGTPPRRSATRTA